MNEQTGAASAAAQSEDAWDRLAALAFGGGGSASGCSEHAHEFECTCEERSSLPVSEWPVDPDTEMESAD